MDENDNNTPRNSGRNCGVVICCLASLLFGFATVVRGQGARYDNIALMSVTNAYGTVTRPVSGASIAVCSQPATINGNTCSPLITVYTSIAATTACNGNNGCANPVTADTNGNFYFYYKIPNAPFTFVIAGSGATTKVMYDQVTFGGTGGTSGGGGSTAIPCVNPVSFGADPTGTTDSTTAINLAITAASAGSTICFPMGTFYVASPPFVITKPLGFLGSAGTSYYSSGPTITTPSGTAYIFDFENSATGSWVQGLTFTSSAATRTAGGGIYYNVSTGTSDNENPFRVSGCSFIKLYNSVVLNWGNSITLVDNHFSYSVNDDILVLNALMLRTARNDGIGAGNDSVEARSLGGWTSDDDQWWGSLHGVVLAPVTSASTQYINLNSIVVDSTTGDGIVLGGTAGKVIHVHIHPNEIGAFSLISPYGGYGIKVNTNVDGVEIAGGAIRENLKDGIYLAGGKNTRIHDVDLSANGMDVGNTYYGVRVAAGVSYWSVDRCSSGAVGADNSDVGSQAGAVYVAAGASTGFAVRDIRMTGGPAGSPYSSPQMLTFGGAVTGFYELRLHGGGNNSNNGASLANAGMLVASGTVGASSTSTVNLANYLPTPSTSGYGWCVHGRFKVAFAAVGGGSDATALVDIMNTNSNASGSIPVSSPNSNIGYATITGTTLSLTDVSGSVSMNYWILLDEVESLL